MSETETQTKTITIALAGNPNVGKSVIFHYLTGVYVDVSNYPGTTIEITSAQIPVSEQDREEYKLTDYEFKLVDTPGVYGVSSLNDEERAARDYILEADIIINVASATTLSRDLFLTKQLADMGKPMVVVLNQCDEAKARKVAIDTDKLSQTLGLEIIKTVAIKAEGLMELKQAILASINSGSTQIRPGKISPAIDQYLLPYIDRVLSRAEALLIAEGDELSAKANDIEPNDSEEREKIYQIRRAEVNDLVEQVVSRAKFSKRAFLGQLLLQPIFGSIVAVLILYSFLFQFLGVFVAGTIVGWLEDGVFHAYYEPWVKHLISTVFPIIENNMDNIVISNPLAAIGTILAGDYGVLTLTITYLYGLLLPLVLGFYFGLAILEDSGYLPRLAVLVDGVLSRLGMNGRAIIPLILGGGCVTMATVTTRLLTNPKEKLITMTLLGLTIPCSAQLGVIQGLLSNVGGIKPWLIWSGTLFIVFVLTGMLLNKIVPGPCGNFISDIPPLRMPRASNIAKKTFTRSKVFLDEATPAFFAAAAIVALLQVTGMLTLIIKAAEPLIEGALLLPKEVTVSFILGMVRRDFGAFGLLDIPMSAAQLVTSCVVLTLFVPCIATVAVMIKEGSLKTAMAIWISSWVLALGIGALLARILPYI